MTGARNVASALAVTLVLMACASSGRAFQHAPPDLVEGITLYQQGRYAEAAATLQGRSGPEANAYLAASLAKQGQYVEAVAAADVALRDDPTHPLAAAALGEALVGQKKYDEAVTRLSEVIGKRKDVAYAYYWRGQAYSNKKEAARMVADFENFVKLAPDAPEAGSVKQLLAGLR